MRLRLLPAGTAAGTEEIPHLSATPEEGGWRLRRFGGAGAVTIGYPTDLPFSLAAYADGRALGETVLDPGLADPRALPSLWRAADAQEGPEAARLIPQPGSGRTRAEWLWLLTSEAAPPFADGEGVSLHESSAAPGGVLWRVSGRGQLQVGDHAVSIVTGAEQDAPEARLTAIGPTLQGWRLSRDGSLVHLGRPTLYGEVGAAPMRRLPDRALSIYPDRGGTLFGEIVSWIHGGDPLARMRLVCLPPAIRLELRETGPGEVELTAEGLPEGTRLALRAGDAETRADVGRPSSVVALQGGRTPPGQITVRFSDARSGAAIELVSAWPARSGIILNPEGQRILRDVPISTAGLRGWRAIVPEGRRAVLEFRLLDHPPLALPVAGEVSIAAYQPLIRELLGQAGPDGQVDLRLVVEGDPGRRLEIRRYDDAAVVRDGTIFAGMARDAPTLAAHSELCRNLHLHIVDLTDPHRSRTVEAFQGQNLQEVLGKDGGPWLIQPRLDSRVQRAVFFASEPQVTSHREERIERFAEDWRRLTATPNHPDWKRMLGILTALNEGGDPAVADQIQALALVPAAAVALVLRVPASALAVAIAVESDTPLFWPVAPIEAVGAALVADHQRRVETYRAHLTQAEACEEADAMLARRIAEVLDFRPDLAGHFGAALAQADLTRIAFARELRDTLLIPDSARRIAELAQEAVRRFSGLPSGVRGVQPLRRPRSVCNFAPEAQLLIDGPFSAAEFAIGARPQPSPDETLALINLRLVDVDYFDSALPAAIDLALRGVQA